MILDRISASTLEHFPGQDVVPPPRRRRQNSYIHLHRASAIVIGRVQSVPRDVVPRRRPQNSSKSLIFTAPRESVQYVLREVAGSTSI